MVAPVQAKILPISDSQLSYANEMKVQLEAAGFRVEIDDRAEKVGLKIREAEMQKVPYMMVMGKQSWKKES